MLKVYNTLTRKKEEFVPLKAPDVHMYVCGMTVYDYCHLGHGRVMVVFDIIARWLEKLGFKVNYVRNITDIDDKIIAAANRNNEPFAHLTSRFIEAMQDDAKALNIKLPTTEPKATAYIPEMIKLITELIAKGYAYVGANNDVYYAVRKFPPYGQLSGKSLDDLRAGERVDINDTKRDPLDFALWKSGKPGEPSWESPWGKGRPGWHIECSAMSAALFGEIFDIHGGGADLEFPHHENELAQNCGVNHRFAIEENSPRLLKSHVKYWIHNGFIRINDEKMSKSLGNFFTIREVLEKFSGEVIRFFLLRTHYRSPLNYSDEHLADAKNALTRLYTTLNNTPPEKPDLNFKAEDNRYTKRFFAAMNDDFNTPEAIAVLFELATQVNKTKDAHLASYLQALGATLGLFAISPELFLKGDLEGASLSAAEINDLIAKRSEARKNKNWAESDRIRDLLSEHHIILEDKGTTTTWRKN